LSELKRIGLFGGTFDPVHLGHTIVAEWIQYSCNLDEVHFIPNYIHPFDKRSDISSAKNRVGMLHLALADFPVFKICEYELERNRVSYTIDTIRYFHKKYPGVDLYYMIGSDNVNDFSSWKDSDKIFDLARVVVHKRSNEEYKQKGKFLFLNSPIIEISSSVIRENIKTGKPFRSFIHPDVAAYIHRHRLFGKE